MGVDPVVRTVIGTAYLLVSKKLKLQSLSRAQQQPQEVALNDW